MSKRFAVIGACLLLACSGDGGSPTEPVSATVSGIVRDLATGQPIAGATLTLGARSGQSGADGRYELAGVSVGGGGTLRVDANGYDVYAQTIDVLPGRNARDVALSRKTLFHTGDFIMFATPQASAYRGVMLYLPGAGADARPFVETQTGGAGGQAQSAADALAEWQKARAVAAKHGLTIMAAKSLIFDESNSITAILAALAQFAALVGRPELADAPIMVYGASNGGCLAYQLARVQSSRVIGFTSMKGGCHALTESVAARSIPAYLFIGAQDTDSRQMNMTQLFMANRPLGALWALGVERETAHTYIADTDLLYEWTDVVLGLRLPPSVNPGTPVVLRPVAESSGWLGDRATFDIAPFASYAGNMAAASWLPNEATARHWRSFFSP